MNGRDEEIREQLRIRRRILPHWQFGGSTYFVTFRSALGILPVEALGIVCVHCLFDHSRRMDLYFGVVMPDHAHLILQPRKKNTETWHDLSAIMKGIKGTSSRRINTLLNRHGAVWQEESFDRIIRNEAEYLEKLKYIYWNPVKAGLVETPEQYRFFLNPMQTISGIVGFQSSTQ